ncbi:unnamed protein product [Scytosiphon promiscuus]
MIWVAIPTPVVHPMPQQPKDMFLPSLQSFCSKLLLRLNLGHIKKNDAILWRSKSHQILHDLHDDPGIPGIAFGIVAAKRPLSFLYTPRAAAVSSLIFASEYFAEANLGTPERVCKIWCGEAALFCETSWV